MNRERLAIMMLASVVAGVAPAQAAEAIAGGSPALAWNGFYFGGHIAAATGASRWRTFDGAPPDAGASSVRARDGQFGPLVGGVQFGFNHIFADRFLVGVETDASFPDDMRSGQNVYSAFAGIYRLEDKVEAFGTARARVGVASDAWLLYATGGLAVSRERLQRAQQVLTPFGGVAGPGDIDTFWQWRYGLAIGGGAEVRLSPDWSAKLEYLYVDLGDGNFRDNSDIVDVAHDFNLKGSGDYAFSTVRATVKYRFQ